MRVRSYSEMLLEYDKEDLEHDSLSGRNEMLSKLPFSFIVEAGHMELDNLEKWIKSEIGEDKVVFLHYGKTDYDFGFAEYFFETENDAHRTAEAVPNIYTIYPYSARPGVAFKSLGYEHEVERDPNDTTAIIFDAPIDT